MWKYVLFLSEDDVASIKRDIGKVTKAKFSSDVQARRDVISRFWRQMANTVLNMDDDAQDLSSLTVGDIKARLRGLKNQGVSFEGGVLDKLTVSQIETLKNEDLNAYMDEIEAKARFWDDVGSSYPFSYYPAGEGDKRKKFYWIPFEFLY